MIEVSPAPSIDMTKGHPQVSDALVERVGAAAVKTLLTGECTSAFGAGSGGVGAQDAISAAMSRYFFILLPLIKYL